MRWASVSFLVLMGCAPAPLHGPRLVVATADGRAVDVSPAPPVQILPDGSSLGCRTRVLGVVDVHTPMGREGALDVLRRRAHALGAEAVVGVGFRHGHDEGEPTHLSGLAVRCEDLLHGRAYHVIARVEATASMGDEAGGLRALRQQARALGADLIVRVEFEHGEGHATRVRGDAVRFRRAP